MLKSLILCFAPAHGFALRFAGSLVVSLRLCGFAGVFLAALLVGLCVLGGPWPCVKNSCFGPGPTYNIG